MDFPTGLARSIKGEVGKKLYRYKLKMKKK
jgi:hypothetical protein